jgi:tetratricopeptide (TPR) repeat protein
MNRPLHIYKKDPLLTILGLLAVILVGWVSLAPAGFKAFWGKNPLVVEMIKEHQQAEQKSKFASVSIYYPYLPYFAGIVAGVEKPRKEWMDTYYLGRPYIFSLYYGKAVEMFPENDAGHYLLGYCAYYSGDQNSARRQFEESMKINPYFFWSYYNLGVIYFQQGDFLKSAEVLNKGLSIKKEFTLEILRQGAFYGQIWQYLANPPQISGRNLDEGQEDAAFLLAVYLIKAGRADQALGIIQSIGLKTAWHQELWGDLYKKAARKQRATEDIDPLIKEQIPVRMF